MQLQKEYVLNCKRPFIPLVMMILTNTVIPRCLPHRLGHCFCCLASCHGNSSRSTYIELIFLQCPHNSLKVKVKVTQSCQTLCDPMDYTVHGILQVRILEWVAIPFSRGSFQPRDQTQVSRITSRFFTS